jgi:peptidylprolyl isomerase/FKBP-type peptidyl-prolyl cis-trans isomerase FklB
MKRILGVLILGICFLPTCLNAAETKVDSPFKTSEEKLSYGMGLDLGKYLKGLGGTINLEVLKEGLDDGFTDAEPKLSQEELTAVQEEFAAEMKAEQEAKMAEIKQKNSAAGKAFLDENIKKEGVKVTESGLQYEVLEKADGAKPKAEDTVKVDYVGTFIDGSEFDSSIKRGEPAVFPVNQVIPGWSEALQLMEVGSKYRVVVPADLAYGEAGAPPVIEPNSVLIFEIDLLGIEE